MLYNKTENVCISKNMRLGRQKLFLKKYGNGDFSKMVYWVMFPVLHSLSVKELLMHTLCHAALQFYKSLTRTGQVYFACILDSGLLPAACFGQQNIHGCNRNRDFTVCPRFGSSSCTSAICHKKMTPICSCHPRRMKRHKE